MLEVEPIHSNVIKFAKLCMYQRESTGYNKNTLQSLQEIFDEAFSNSTIKVTVFPMALTIGDHVIKEVYGYGTNDFFYVKISFKKSDINIPQGGTSLQKETAFLNQINELIPKYLKRCGGFVAI